MFPVHAGCEHTPVPVYTKILKDKIEEYQAENRLPDEEMEHFYIQLRKRFARFWNGLAEEWENEHRGKL